MLRPRRPGRGRPRRRSARSGCRRPLNALVARRRHEAAGLRAARAAAARGRRGGRGRARFLVADPRGRRRLLEELGDRARRRPAGDPGRGGPPLGGAPAGLLRALPLPPAAAADGRRSRSPGQGLHRHLRRGQPARPRRHERADQRRAPDPGAAWPRGCGWWRSSSPARPGAPRWRSRAAGTGRSRTPTSARAASRCAAARGRRGSAGTLTTWRGKIEAQAPRCATIGFDRGTLQLHRRPAGHRVPLQGHARGQHRDRHHRAQRAGPRRPSRCSFVE